MVPHRQFLHPPLFFMLSLLLALVFSSQPVTADIWERNLVLDENGVIRLDQVIIWRVERHQETHDYFVVTWQHTEGTSAPKAHGASWLGVIHGKPIMVHCVREVTSTYDREVADRDRLPPIKRSWR